MKILLGKYIIQWTRSINGAPFGQWKTLDIPKESTASLETDDGNKVEAKDDWGKTVDSYTEPGTSTLAFELFKKKGLALPFKDTDGVITQEYAFRVISALDSAAPGFQIDRASISAKRTWGKEDSYRVAYTATALEPATGAMVKDLGIDLETSALEFNATAGTNTIVIENSNGSITIAIPDTDTWLTASVSDSILTVNAAANTATTERTSEIVLTDGTGFTASVVVNQEAAAETPQVATPVLTRGTDDEINQVTITTATDGASIYYTTDGSTPTAQSTPYTDAITISGSSTIKAIAIKAGFTDSEVATQTFEEQQ
ncbi:MAG: chitobiase/beta-hexosaminidase C-terminal domain-containing protein [Bacteroidales bacterium]|nr:chitobiase/beta-hexosaminidase C-terminal domain-containing protein [Bacteroidales bacterium]